MTRVNDETPRRVRRGWQIVIVGIASTAVFATSILAAERPLVAIALLAATALGGAAWLAITHFELLTLIMVGARTAIELSHDGAEGALLRPSVVVTGGYTVLALGWLVVNRVDRPLRISPVAKCVAILASTTLISALLSADRAQAFTGASRWVFLAVFLVVLENIVTDQGAVRRLLMAVGVSTLVPLAMGTWQLIQGGGQLVDGISRVEGSLAHPNTYGFYLAVLTLLLIAVSRNLPTRFWTVAALLLAALVINLIATYSRTSYVAFVVGLLVIGFAGRRWLLLVVSVAAIAAVTFVPAVQVRFSDLGESATARGTPGNSLAWRVEYWDDVIDAGEGRRVTGLGLGVVSDVTEQRREPHNDFIRSFVELGAIGLTAYAALLLAIAWQIRGTIVRSSPANGRSGLPHSLAIGYCGIFAAYLVGSLTGNLMTQLVLLWYVFSIAVAASQPIRVGRLADDVGMGGVPGAPKESLRT